jgi:hypothetical protein
LGATVDDTEVPRLTSEGEPLPAKFLESLNIKIRREGEEGIKSYQHGVNRLPFSEDLNSKKQFEPERPSVYNDIEVMKRTLLNFKSHVLSSNMNESLKQTILARQSLVLLRYGLIGYKPLAQYIPGRNYFSLFYYLPLQMIVREVRYGIPLTVLRNRLPWKFLNSLSEYFGLLERVTYKSPTIPAKKLFSCRNFCNKRLKDLTSITNALVLYRSNVVSRFEMEEMTIQVEPERHDYDYQMLLEAQHFRELLAQRRDDLLDSSSSVQVIDIPSGSIGFGDYYHESGNASEASDFLKWIIDPNK